MERIVAIWFPVDDPAQPLVAHAVGRNGVTRIEKQMDSAESEAFFVYEGDNLRWKLADHHAGVEYAPEGPSKGKS